MVSEDKITMEREDIILILEPYGEKWSVSVIKNLSSKDYSYGQRWLQTKIYPYKNSYEAAKSEFMRGVDAMCSWELSFEDVCRRTFGKYEPEYFTYKMR